MEANQRISRSKLQLVVVVLFLVCLLGIGLAIKAAPLPPGTAQPNAYSSQSRPLPRVNHKADGLNQPGKPANPVPFAYGDVFVGVGGGNVNHYNSQGTLLEV